ncbi:hypothetical protein, partial [Clostridium tarantellae]
MFKNKFKEFKSSINSELKDLKRNPNQELKLTKKIINNKFIIKSLLFIFLIITLLMNLMVGSLNALTGLFDESIKEFSILGSSLNFLYIIK